METFDVVVVGGGPGGYPAAIRAAQLGAKVALVEKECLGGTCLNWGCIPTKTLIASADLYHRAAHGAALGVSAKGLAFDYARMVARKDEVVAKLRGGVGMLLKANGVKVFEGTASFTARNRLQVAGGNAAAIEAGAVIIATGSTSVVPGFLPKGPRVLESRAFLARNELPKRLIVMGGGVIGCEFACMAAQLGAEVTVVELLEDILLVLDKDIRRELVKQMKKLGIAILTGKPLEDIRADEAGVSGRVGDTTLSADVLLAAIGRRPVTEGLNLAAAGLAPDPRGAIPVDECGRTAKAGIYAIGDVTAGSTQLAHAATAQGVTAAETACAGGRRPAETVVPACIFTAPEVGCVGLSEARAAESGRAVETGTFSFAGLGKALAAGEPEGFVKWVADKRTGQLLGAHAIGAHATELIAEAAVAIRNELTVAELGRTVHCHPTFSESWMEAAHAVHGECIHAAPKRRP